jgi:hypothetical protein
VCVCVISCNVSHPPPKKKEYHKNKKIKYVGHGSRIVPHFGLTTPRAKSNYVERFRDALEPITVPCWTFELSGEFNP